MKHLSIRISSILLLLSAVFTPSFVLAQSSNWKRAKICIDTEEETVRLRRRCREPRFVEVTTDQLAPTVELVTDSYDIELTSTDDVAGRSIECPEGKVVTGGGASVVDNLGLNMKTSIPRIALNGWQASVSALRNNATGTLNIYAICSTGISIADSDEE